MNRNSSAELAAARFRDGRRSSKLRPGRLIIQVESVDLPRLCDVSPERLVLQGGRPQ